MAVAIADQGHDIWIWDLARQAFSQVTLRPIRRANFAPVWTPDGNRLIFFTPRRRRALRLFWQPADGHGAAEPLGGGGPPSGVDAGRRR